MPSHDQLREHRNRRSSLKALKNVAASEQAETETEHHATVRRLARLFDDLFPEVGRIRCWLVASQLADVDSAVTIRPTYLQALVDVASAALALNKSNEETAQAVHAWLHREVA